jgi:tRNA-2-methylthio-N6-dimethylallyladenosine synthase
MEDDVPETEKSHRLQRIEGLQAQVVAEINSRFLGQTLPILVEDLHKGKWRGRTPHNKLVFFEDSRHWKGQVVDVEITWTGPWSMQGRLPGSQSPEWFEIPVITANHNARESLIALKS